MAIPMIETGYKPEYALGALYQGFNAGNADMSSREEILRQFLANEKAKQMNPLEVEQRQLENRGIGFDLVGRELNANRNAGLMTPEMLSKFVQSKGAEMDESINKGETSNMLQPFVRQQIPLEQGAKTKQLESANELAQIDALLNNGGYDSYGNQATPEQMQQWQQMRTGIVERMGQTPDLYGKSALEHIKGGYDLQRAEIAANAARFSAEHGGKAAWAQAIGPATQAVNSIVTNITKLNNNEFGDYLAGIVKARGHKPGTPEYEKAMVSEKDNFRKQLMAQLSEAQGFLRQIQQASGFQAQAPTGGVIKLD